jgi:hypothetical protein
LLIGGVGHLRNRWSLTNGWNDHAASIFGEGTWKWMMWIKQFRLTFNEE